MGRSSIRTVALASLLAGALLLRGKPDAVWHIASSAAPTEVAVIASASPPAAAVAVVTAAKTLVRPPAIAAVVASTSPVVAAVATAFAECPVGAPCASAHGVGPAVAIYLVGLKRRLLLNSTLERAVRPLREHFGAHFYASLVDDSGGDGAWLRVRSRGVADPAVADLVGEGLRGNIRDRLAAAGACLMCLDLHSAPEPLPELPQYKDIMTQYSPHKTATGARAVRMWLTRERLWNLTLANEAHLGFEYTFLMWVRDDMHWLARWQPAELFASPSANITVWSSECGAWGGISDKAVIFGRRAAPGLLTLFTAYMSGSIRGRINNAEKFLQAAARKHGTRQVSLKFSVLPVAPAMLIDLGNRNSSNVTLCMVKFYWCAGNLSAFNVTTEFCEVFDAMLRQQEKQRPRPRR